MLTKKDIEWIKNNRKETTYNRTFPITLKGEVEQGEDPITGEPIVEVVAEDTKATVTEITSAFKTDIGFVSGVEVEKGDLWVVIDLDDIALFSHDGFEDIIYDSVSYRVLAADREGIGEHNRVTIVARKVD